MTDGRAVLGRVGRVAVLTLVVAAVAVGGAAAGVLGVPSVSGVDNRFGPVDAERTVVETDLHVSNPNPLGASVGGLTVDYRVAMNGVGMANGTKRGVTLERGNSTVPFRSEMRNERIPAWWVSHVKNGERTTLTVDASVTSSLVGGAGIDAPAVERRIETDVVGGFASKETRPVNADQPLVSDPVLYVNETDAEWGAVNRATTPIETTFDLYNPKAVPITLTETGYDVTMNGVPVGEGATERSYVIPSHERRTLATTPRIDNSKLDEWWVSHLRANQTTDLRIEFYAEFRVAGETLRVPLDSLTYTKTIETDLFGNEGTNGSGADGSTDEADGTDGTGTATATPTPTGDASEGDDGSGAATTSGDGEGGTTDDGGLLGGSDGGDGTTTDDGGFLDGRR
jgi:LEA14-like dessication related protein